MPILRGSFNLYASTILQSDNSCLGMDCSVSKLRFIVGEYEPLLLRYDLKKPLILCKNGVDVG